LLKRFFSREIPLQETLADDSQLCLRIRVASEERIPFEEVLADGSQPCPELGTVRKE
jgi:hypothetical protein